VFVLGLGKQNNTATSSVILGAASALWQKGQGLLRQSGYRTGHTLKIMQMPIMSGLRVELEISRIHGAADLVK
jgi:hypothetical protein